MRTFLITLTTLGAVAVVLPTVAANAQDRTVVITKHEALRHAPPIVIDAIAAKQTLIASHLFHSLLCITKVCHEGMLRL